MNKNHWPQAIAHVDADAFFASVEQALNPNLKDLPIIIGAERGIVVASSYEAKAKGIKRGMPLLEVTRLCPECILLSSDYESYSFFSKHIFEIIKRFTPDVEEYSIDEAFFNLTGTRRLHHASYQEIARKIQQTIKNELDITVSIGVSVSKSLAKLCSKFNKPYGLTTIRTNEIEYLLKQTPIKTVWGFGHNTCALLSKYGISTAFDFINRPEYFAKDLLGKIGSEIRKELRGEYVYKINTEIKTKQLSISKFQTFTPADTDKQKILARALRNLENACIKTRRLNQVATKIILSLKTQDFSIHNLEFKLFRPSASPIELNKYLIHLFNKLFKNGEKYRATGVILAGLKDNKPMQFNFLEEPEKIINNIKLFEAVDNINNKFGKHKVFISNGLYIKSKPTNKTIGIPFFN